MTVFTAAWWRALGPLAWAGLALLAILLLAMACDPLGWRARQLERARQSAAAGQIEARYRREEKAAQQWLAQKQQQIQQQQADVSDVTARAIEEARGQADGQTVLGDDRIGRLREHDRFLCQHTAGLGGCAAASGPAA